MTERERIVELVAQVLDTDRTPEEVCVDCPELVERVRADADRARQLQRELDQLYPALADESSEPRDVAPAANVLPVIDGYDVVGVLGRGGMGIVYKAHHKKLNRPVALKTLVHGAFAAREERTRFEREAETIGALQHPNIVQVHDVGEVRGVPYFTMEFIEGGTLSQKLAGSPWASVPAAALVATLADAVQAAHARGIVHRDLKPSNVLIAAGDTPKITDFGLARRVEGEAALTLSGARIGTPSYMAPEQALGDSRSIGPASDIYSLGAILYEALTGRPPFLGETALETQRQVVSDEVVPPSRLNSSIQRDLETICLKCLEKDPAHRYARAADLAEDLRRFQRGEPVSARRTGVLGRVVRWVKRRPAAAGLIGVMTLVVAAAAAGVWSLLEQRAAGHLRQLQADREVREVLDGARGPIQRGWQEADLASLTDLTTRADRAVDRARLSGASEAVQEEAAAFNQVAHDRLDCVRRDRALLESILDASTSRDLDSVLSASPGAEQALSRPSSEAQYAAAFRQWGLDVDGTPLTESVARLLREPPLVVEEIVAGVDEWMVACRKEGRPESEWRRLSLLADGMDRDDRRHRLRALLIEGVPGTVESDTALHRLCEELDPTTQPVLTVLLLQRTCRELGDAATAESVLRRALMVRPDQVTLLGALGTLLAKQKPPRYEESIGYFRAARSLRPRLGIALSSVLLRAGRVADATELLRELTRIRPSDPVPYHYLGRLEVKLRKDDEALQDLRKALELRPGDMGTNIDVGIALLNVGMHREAEDSVRVAVEHDPGSATALDALGCVYRAEGRRGEAEAAWRRTIELDPRFAIAYDHLGIALFDRGELDEAEANYRKAIELDPEWSNAHFNLGVMQIGRGRLDEAEAEFRTAAEVDPLTLNAYSYLGVVLQKLGRNEEAAAAFRKAIDLTPNRAELHASLGSVLNHLGKHSEAEAACRKACEIDPDSALAHLNLSAVLNAEGRFAEAETAARRSVELDPADAKARCNLAKALAKQRKLAESEAEYRIALEREPDFADAYAGLGIVLFDRADYPGAETMFRKLLELQPDRARAWCDLARCLVAQGRVDEAIAPSRRAVELDSELAPGFAELGTVLDHDAKYSEAEAAFRRALELDPHDSSSYRNLGIVEVKLRDPRNAEAAIRKCIELEPKDGLAHLILGRSLMEEVRLSEAAAEIEMALTGIPVTSPLRTEALGLRRECEQFLAIEPRLSGILERSERASTPEEALDLALLCRCKHLDVEATRFFEEAFELDPRLADDLTSEYRYKAAACAICVAADDRNDLDEAERIRLRKEAHEWLTASLAMRRLRIAAGGAQRAEQVRQLKGWLADPDFASVRDAKARDQLPEEESPPWKAFWEQVESIARAHPAKN